MCVFCSSCCLCLCSVFPASMYVLPVSVFCDLYFQFPVSVFCISVSMICTSCFLCPRCELEIDECESNPCRNGGRCLDRFNMFLCECPSGFSGAICDTNVCACLLSGVICDVLFIQCSDHSCQTEAAVSVAIETSTQTGCPLAGGRHPALVLLPPDPDHRFDLHDLNSKEEASVGGCVQPQRSGAGWSSSGDGQHAQGSS